MYFICDLIYLFGFKHQLNRAHILTCPLIIISASESTSISLSLTLSSESLSCSSTWLKSAPDASMFIWYRLRNVMTHWSGSQKREGALNRSGQLESLPLQQHQAFVFHILPGVKLLPYLSLSRSSRFFASPDGNSLT